MTAAPVPPLFPLRVYYDGACTVCAREMAHYARRDRAGRLVLVDISDPAFDPAPLGLEREALMAELHAVDAAGRVYRNTAAFWAVWQAFPASTLLGLLGKLVVLPVTGSIARAGYFAFARMRKYLPRRRCDGGSCRL